MSMNLHCEEMDLWQSPTAITYMCYSHADGGWQGIKYRYIQWVKGSLNGVWDDEAEHKSAIKAVNEHIEELNSYEKLNFFVM